MIRSFVAAAAALIIGISVPVQAAQAATKTYEYNESFPIAFQQYVPCAGEVVALSGSIHIRYTSTSDGKGGFKFTYHSNYQGARGKGLTSGAQYSVSGVGNGAYSSSPGDGYSYRTSSMFHVAGKNANYKTQWNYRMGANPDGTMKVQTENYRVICK